MIYLIKKTFLDENYKEIVYYKFYVKWQEDYIEIKVQDYFAKKMLIDYAIKNNLIFDKISDIISS